VQSRHHGQRAQLRFLPQGDEVAQVRPHQSSPRKSLFRNSKEIAKPAVFVQPTVLSELARSETGRTILRQNK